MGLQVDTHRVFLRQVDCSCPFFVNFNEPPFPVRMVSYKFLMGPPDWAFAREKLNAPDFQAIDKDL
jgi:hypothetical protein